MTNPAKQAIDETINRLEAGFPLLWIQSDEHGRAAISLQLRIEEENQKIQKKIDALQAEGKTIPPGLQPSTLLIWDVLNGLVEASSGRVLMPVSTAPGPTATPAYRHILAWANQIPTVPIPQNAIIIVNGFHNLLAMTTETARVRAAFLQIIAPVTRKLETAPPDGENQGEHVVLQGLRDEESFRSVILIGPKTDSPVLSPDVVAFIERVDFPRPSEEELKEALLVQMDGRKTRSGELVLADKDKVNRCVAELKGTTLFQAENALTLTYIKHRDLDEVELRHQYKKIIEMHPAIHLAHFEENWDNLIGFDAYKEYVRALFAPNGRDRNKKGMFLLGIPGGGKSHAAKATGNHLRRKTLTVNIGRVFHKHVGTSEGNVDSMLCSINGCGESIVFIDEMEKAFGGMGHGGDGGVSSRVLEQWLIWMNDHPEGPFLIGTANEVADKLPQELLREGRWNAIWFVPPPTLLQRKGLFELYLGIAGIKADISEHVERTNNWTGAEIKGLAEKAETLRNIFPDDETALDKAYRLVKPLCIADPQKFQERMEDGKRRGINVNGEEQDQLIQTVEPTQTTSKKVQRRSIS